MFKLSGVIRNSGCPRLNSAPLKIGHETHDASALKQSAKSWQEVDKSIRKGWKTL